MLYLAPNPSLDPTAVRVLLQVHTLCVLTFTPANFYPSKSLWFRGKCAFRHLRAIKSVSVMKCGNFNYQKGENQGLVVKSKPL